LSRPIGAWERWRASCCGPSVRQTLVLFAVLRVGFSLWAGLVLTLVPAEVGPSDVSRPYFDLLPVDEGWAGWLLGPWQRFDTLHYLTLARHGYQAGTQHTVFPPLYPWLIRIVGGMMGGQHLLAALLISNVGAIGYLVVIFALAQQEVGPAAARKAQVYAALYPWAFALLAGYSESLFLLLVGLAFWLALRGCGWAAGLCGGLAALTRMQGGALALPLLFIALRRRGFRVWPLCQDLLWPLLPVLASVGFLLGRAWAGIEPLSAVYATSWHQAPAFPWMGMATHLRNVWVGVAHPTDCLDFLAAWLAIALTVVAWRRLDPAYALYMSVNLLISLSHLRMRHPMCSVGRYTMTLFPGLFLLGVWGARSVWLNRLILYLSLLLLAWLSGQFFLWGWAG